MSQTSTFLLNKCDIPKPPTRLGNKLDFEGLVFPPEAVMPEVWKVRNSSKEVSWLETKQNTKFSDLSLKSLLKVFMNVYKDYQEQLLFKGLNERKLH